MAISTAILPSAIARVVGIKTEFKNLRKDGLVNLPQRVALFGQGSSASVYSTTKAVVTSALAVAEVYGFGSPLHLAALQLFPDNGDGVGALPVTVYPLVDDVGGAPSVGDITPAGTVTKAAQFTVLINNIRSGIFTIAIGDTVADIVTAITAAVAAELRLPMLAADGVTKVDLTSKWEGVSANDLQVAVEGPTDAGITFGITQPVGGLVNPNIDAALAQVGGVWETMGLNCLEVGDTVSLDKYSAFGEGRWGALVRKPLVFFSGNTETVVATAVAVPDARKTDRVNSQLVAPGSVDLPFVTAARQLARIVVLAATNPPHDYGSQDATGLTPGTDGEQWDNTERELAVQSGSSTVQVKDRVVNISDVVTFYHPTGDLTPAYRYAVDVVKLQNIIFNTDLIFATPEWDGAPLLPDDQATTNASAKKPKMAKAAIASLIDRLALAAIISNPEAAKASIEAGISETNPKRLDVSFTVQLSGNANVISIDLNFGFFFGTAQLAA